MGQQQREVTDYGCQRQRSCSAMKKSPCFFRLIVSPTQYKLRIPGKFIKKLGDELPNIATLITPNGCICHVKLEKIDEKFCFTDGWHEFVKHQSIGVDYLLIFTYLGNSSLRVRIYDIGYAEINYRCDALRGPSCGYRVSVKEEVEEDDCIEILDSFPQRQTRTSGENKEGCSVYVAKVNSAKGDTQHIANDLDKAPVPCVHSDNILGEPSCGYQEPIKEEVEDDDNVEILESDPPFQTPKSSENKEADSVYGKRAKVNRVGIFNSTSSLSHEAKGDKQQSQQFQPMTPETRLNQIIERRNLDEHEDSAHNIRKFPSSGAETSFRRSRASTPCEKAKVLNASMTFQSGNPFCRIFLCPSYVSKGFSLHLPSSFAEKYLRGVSGFLTLAVSGGEEWRIGCTWLSGSAKLSKGWHQFVLGNKLEEGDVCVFELLKAVDVVLKVSIFRAAQVAEPEKRKRKEKMQNFPYGVTTRSKSVK